MTINLKSLDRWMLLAGDKALVLSGKSGGGERRVRIAFNVGEHTRAYVSDAGGEERLLAVLQPGLETVEFTAPGVLHITTDASEGAEVWVQTAETEPTFVEVIDPVIFTRIANRRHRNPELEEMMYRMQLNVERRLAAQKDEFEAALERRRMEEDHGRPAETIKTDAPGAAADGAGAEVSAPEQAAAQPGQPAGSADGGQQPGDNGGTSGEAGRLPS